MKAIMVMYDSLNRRFLEPYGCDWVLTPNFRRLANRSATFDNCYVGSMPCMPARRELHTGRYNFLHRSWGPIEPFDDSMPEMLKKSGVHSHLTSDHYHYWEDGGCTYHTRYKTWEIARGQEGDPWKGDLRPLQIPEPFHPQIDCLSDMHRQDMINRKYMQEEELTSQAVTFEQGLEFIRTNHAQDDWFLHIETFDPHEPYFTLPHDKVPYANGYSGPHFDWPAYGPVTESPEMVEHCRLEQAALTTKCDRYLGKVLDAMDEYGLWEDTMLIVNTDHGFLLGEHDFWGKSTYYYDEVVHTPLFIWDPRCRVAGVRRKALVQTIDLPATLLDFFGVELPATMQGVPLGRTVADDTPVRQAALFGSHGGPVNCTDGRYVYMRAAANTENRPLYNYTLMPTHMRHSFAPEELQDFDLAEPFTFTKGVRTMRIPSRGRPRLLETRLYDLQTDPEQQSPINDAEVEERMAKLMAEVMAANDAPPEQYQRLGLDR